MWASSRLPLGPKLPQLQFAEKIDGYDLARWRVRLEILAVWQPLVPREKNQQ